MSHSAPKRKKNKKERKKEEEEENTFKHIFVLQFLDGWAVRKFFVQNCLYTGSPGFDFWW